MFWYTENTNNYRLLDLESGRIVESRNVQFFENIFPFKDEILNETTHFQSIYDYNTYDSTKDSENDSDYDINVNMDSNKSFNE